MDTELDQAELDRVAAAVAGRVDRHYPRVHLRLAQVRELGGGVVSVPDGPWGVYGLGCWRLRVLLLGLWLVAQARCVRCRSPR